MHSRLGAFSSYHLPPAPIPFLQACNGDPRVFPFIFLPLLQLQRDRPLTAYPFTCHFSCSPGAWTAGPLFVIPQDSIFSGPSFVYGYPAPTFEARWQIIALRFYFIFPFFFFRSIPRPPLLNFENKISQVPDP